MDRFKEDKLFNGFLASFLATLIGAFVVLLVQKFLHLDILLNMKMYIFAVIPEILILRWYAKVEKHKALKGSVLSLVLTLGTIIVVLKKYNYLEI